MEVLVTLFMININSEELGNLLWSECVSHQNWYVEILTPKVMVLGGPLGGDSVMKVEPSGMGLVVLQNRPKEACSLLPSEGTARSCHQLIRKLALSRR